MPSPSQRARGIPSESALVPRSAAPPPELKRILVPLDGSPLAERVLTLVRWILSRHDAEVVLLTVLEDSESGEGSIEATCDYLEWQRQNVLGERTSVLYKVLVGNPVEKILSFAKQYGPSLIAMSTHGATGVTRWVRGSVTESVMRASPFPVLACSASAFDERGEETGAPRNILVPLDASTRSAEVLPIVRELAKMAGATVTLFHALEPVLIPVGFPIVVESSISPIAADSMLEPFRVALLEEGVAVRVRTAPGPAATTILRVARREKADLIAMTTHGRSGLSRAVFGSVAEEVLRRCRCPVLVKRTAPLP